MPILSFDSGEFQDVEFSLRGAMGMIMLNRDKALNALSLPMIEVMLKQLDLWAYDQRVAFIVLTHRPQSKAFSAGGDIRSLWQILKEKDGVSSACEYFAKEYRLDGRLHHYPKPIISFINGLWMGGGVGIGLHTRFKVVGEQALFAMPEGFIGFFPDVGASYELSRLPHRLGLWLVLSGQRLGARNLLALGLVDYFLPSPSFADFLNNLERLSLHYENEDQLTDMMQSMAKASATKLPSLASDEPDCLDPQFQQDIAKSFATTDLVAIADNLGIRAQEGKAWAKASLAAFGRMSPVSQIIMAEAMERASSLSLAEVLRQDLQLACYFCAQSQDLSEGIRAVIINKDNQPQWRMASWQDCGASQKDRHEFAKRAFTYPLAKNFQSILDFDIHLDIALSESDSRGN